MDSDAQQMEWLPNSSSYPRSNYRDGCLSSGLGSSHKQNEPRWSLVGAGKSSPHKPVGASRWSSGHKDFHKGHAEHPCPPQDGQHNCHSLYKPDGGHEIPYPLSSSLRPVVLGPSAEDNTVSSTPPRNTEPDSRRRVQNTTIISRMDAGEVSMLQHHAAPGSMFSGPLCNPPEQSSEEVSQLAPPPLCDSNGCLYYVLVGGSWVCISPILPNQQMSAESSPRGVCGGANSSSVGYPTLVPSTPGPPNTIPPDVTSTRATSGGPLQQSTPTSGEKPAPASHLEAIRERHIAEGVSRKASKLIQAGWSKGTNKAYQSGWSRWASWCVRRKIDPISADISHFLEFLAGLYDEGLQHRSINAIRSAVSMTHKHVEGSPIGQHPLVTRLLMGIYNNRPPQPRYSTMWDVDVVTRHLVLIGSNQSLTLKQLSQKLVILMALVEVS